MDLTSPQAQVSDTRRGQALSIKSGPGAPIFEHGPQTRIRRTPVRALATFTWSGGPRELFGTLVNLSPGGCLLKTEASLSDGQQLLLSLTLLQNQQRIRIDIGGRVRRQTEAGGRQAFGIEFVPQNSDERRALQALYTEALR